MNLINAKASTDLTIPENSWFNIEELETLGASKSLSSKNLATMDKRLNCSTFASLFMSESEKVLS